MKTLIKMKLNENIGNWYYEEILPKNPTKADKPVYRLYNGEKVWKSDFDNYFNMKFYILTSVLLGGK